MKSLAWTATLALLFNACGGEPDRETPAARPTVEGTEVVSALLPTFVTVTGDVRPSARAELATRVMAHVTAVPVDLGTRVSAGQTLLRLGMEDIAAARQRSAAGARLAEAALAEAQRHAARMDTLFSQDAVARVQRDQAQLGLTRAQADLAMAQAQLAEVETAAGYSELRAPFAGVVVSRSVDPGDLASPGVPLLVVERAGPREAVLYLSGDAAAHVSTGDSIRVVAGDGRAGYATVRAISGGADPMTRTIEVKAELPADWPTGTALTGFVVTGEHSGVAIPADVVVRRGQLTGVQVVQGGHAVLRWIRLGRLLPDGRFEVLSGLAPGERIVS